MQRICEHSHNMNGLSSWSLPVATNCLVWHGPLWWLSSLFLYFQNKICSFWLWANEWEWRFILISREWCISIVLYCIRMLSFTGLHMTSMAAIFDDKQWKSARVYALRTTSRQWYKLHHACTFHPRWRTMQGLYQLPHDDKQWETLGRLVAADLLSKMHCSR